MAHGYAKVAGKPMAAMVHGTVGTQHAAMAIYNAYCDRVPIMVFTGNAGALDERRPGVEWFHSVQDAPPPCATSSSGTIIRCRFSILPSRPCVAMRWPAR